MVNADANIAVGRLFKLLIEKKILTEDEVNKLLKEDKNKIPEVALSDVLNRIQGLEQRIIELESEVRLLKFEYEKKKT